MRKRKIILDCFSVLFGMIIIISCNDEQLSNLPITKTEKGEKSETGKMLSLPSKTDLLNLIEQEIDLKSLKTRIAEENFISMMDVLKKNDPILDNFSIEEQEYIKENELTYYDVLGFEDLIPNENFAQLLNSKGDIQVSDTIYRITPYGTLYTAVGHEEELETIYSSLANDSIKFNNDDYELKLSKNVALINTFDRVSIDYNISPEESKFPLPGAFKENSKEDIPYQNFKRYSNGSHTLVGKALGGIFGDRSVKHHDFMKDHRVKGSLYDYDYGVYFEIGTYVAMRKKRGGFLKKINGWKGIQADQLSIIYKGILLEMDTKVPANLGIPETPIVIRDDVKLSLPGASKQLFCVDIICSISITDKDIIKLANMGLKPGLKMVKEWTKKEINPNTKAIRILTSSKVFVIIFDDQIDEYNVDQVRKVFNSGVRFFISNTMIKNPLSIKTAFDLMKSLQNLPIKRMVCGEVILAGKLNNKWGGMIIYKD